MATGNRKGMRREERAVYVISIAAELAGVHPQTLRMYERKGLLSPRRTSGQSRRYSDRDVEHVRLIQSLTQEHGVNLAGVEMVMALTRQLEETRRRMAMLEAEVAAAQERIRDEVERVRRSMRADLVPLRNTMIPYPKER